MGSYCGSSDGRDSGKKRQIFETIGGLLDREIVHLYKPGLNFGEVSDPHSAALGRGVSLGGYGFAGKFARGHGWKPVSMSESSLA